MGKILEAFKRFKHQIHEADNAEALKHISPCAALYDIHHQFSNNKKHRSRDTLIFDSILKRCPHVYNTALNYYAYEESNAQNQVLLHGFLYNALFNVYMKHFKKCFNDPILYEAGQSLNQDKTIIDFIEYNKLPKRYRCLFVQYDDDHYILNIPHAKMIISYNKKDKKELESLFLRAKMLIPAIYKERAVFGFPTSFSAPAVAGKTLDFVPDSLDAKLVSDEQLRIVRELHDIFVDIAKITLPIEIKPSDKTRDVYDEYIREKNQKGTVLSAYNMEKNAKTNQKQAIESAKKRFEQRKNSINESYKQCRTVLMQTLSENISVRIK